MNERPTAWELLAVARETFAREIVPAVSDELRYTALMIANAMAIAMRESHDGGAAAARALQRLRELFGDAHSDRAALDRRLAEALRTGLPDGAIRAAVFTHLEATTRDLAAISNPKALE